MSKVTKEERELRECAAILKDEIEMRQFFLGEMEKKIMRLFQKRCPHRRIIANEGGDVYCHKCKKSLS
ncbi:MAG: hypothetical protein WC878_00620 [Candidatus Paceibacterota bacterium]|jgi:hypothetical protein